MTQFENPHAECNNEIETLQRRIIELEDLMTARDRRISELTLQLDKLQEQHAPGKT